MDVWKNKRMRTTYGLVLLTAVMLLGVTGLFVASDSSDAADATSGDIKDSGEHLIGTWNIDDSSQTIFVSGTDSAGIPSKFNGFPDSQDFSAYTVDVTGFAANDDFKTALSGILCDDPYNVPEGSIIYHPEIVSANGKIGTWSLAGTTLTLTPTDVITVQPTALVGFTSGSSVTDVIIESLESSYFNVNICEAVESLTNSSISIAYQGKLPEWSSTNNNLWSYDGEHTLTVTSAGSGTLYDKYTSGTGSTIFTNLFFTDSVTDIIIHNFTKGGQYLFKDFSNATSMSSDSITEFSKGILITNSTTTTIENLSFTQLSTLGNSVFSDNTVIKQLYLPRLISIGDSTFMNATSLESIVVSANLNSMSSKAFSGCTSLSSINTLGNLGTLPTYAFDNCTSLTSIDLGNITTISSYAFRYSGLTSVTIPNGCTKIDTWAFAYCSSLTSVDLGSGLQTICEYAFYESGVSGTVAFPEPFQIVKDFAFMNCNGLEEITFNSNIDLTIGRQAFLYCGGLRTASIYTQPVLDGEGNPTGVYHNLSLGFGTFGACALLNDLTFRAEKITIDSKCFTGCESLTEVDFSGSAVTVGSEAFIKTSMHVYASTVWRSFDFNALSSLTTVKFGSKASSIDSYAFGSSTAANACSSLTYLDLGTGMTSIGYHAFYNCAALLGARQVGEDVEPIVLTPSLTSLGESSFRGCSSLRKLVIEEDCEIASIPKYCFYGDSNIEGNLIIPKKVTTIGDQAFYNCTKITGIDMRSPVLTTINSNSFQKCSSLESVVIDGSALSEMQNSIFVECPRLKTVSINHAILKTIKSSAFSGCTSLESFVIDGTKLETIESSAFSGCTNLVEFTFGSDSLKEIQHHAFYNCASLTSFSIKNSDLKVIEYQTFQGCSNLASFNIEGTALEEIQYLAFYECKKLTSFDFDNTQLREIENRAFQSCNLLSGDYTFPSTLERIEYSAFYDCWELGDIRFAYTDEDRAAGRGIKVIDYNAFRCTWKDEYTVRGIASIVIPDSLIFLGSNAFHDATRITSAIIGWDERGSSDPIYTGKFAAETFRGCVNLTYVEIHEGISTIGTHCFYSCYRLTDVHLPDSVETISQYCFYNCYALVTIDLNHAKYIGNPNFTPGNEDTCRTFYNCRELTTIIAPYAEEIYYRSIESCPKLVNVEFGQALTKVEVYAFYQLYTLKSITVRDGTGDRDVVAYSNGLYVDKTLVLYSNALEATMTIMDGTVKINDYVCYQSKITGKVTIPSTVNTIGYHAFYNSDKITEVEILSTTSTLFDTKTVSNKPLSNAFGSCDAIRALTIPINVKCAYVFCNQDGNGGLPSNFSELNIIGTGTSGLGNYYEQNYKFTPWYRANGNARITVTFDNLVTAVDSYMFAENSKIKNVILGSGVTAIGVRAFYGNTNLVKLQLPNGLMSVGSEAFSGCTAVTDFTCPLSFDATALNVKFAKLVTLTITEGSNIARNYTSNNYTSLPWNNTNNAFTLTLSPNVENIGSYMFKDAKVKNLVLNDNLKTIGEWAFSGITNVEFKILTLPSGITSIGANAFYGCTSLTTAYLPITFDYSVDILGGCPTLLSFYFTPGSNGKGQDYTETSVRNTVWGMKSDQSSIRVYLQEGVVSIGEYMFAGCSRLSGNVALGISSVTLPNSLVEIEAYAFKDCSNMSTVTFGNSLKTIGNSAFEGCSSMGTGIELPETLREIGKASFYGCSSISSLTIPLSVDAVVDNAMPAFSGCTNLTTFRFIGLSAGYDYTFESSSDHYYALTPWNAAAYPSISFGEITRIGNYTFYGMNFSSAILSIPDTLESIGNYAFANSTRLSTIYDTSGYGIDNLTTIGNGAFENSQVKFINSSNSLSLSGVQTIGENAFAMCPVIDVELGTVGVILDIADGVFHDCPALKTITVHGTVDVLGYTMFRTPDTPASFESPLTTITATNVESFESSLADNFPFLETIDISGTTKFGSNAGLFENCVKLKTVRLNTTSASYPLPEKMFKGCTELTTIDLSKVSLSRGHEFEGCSSLSSVNLQSCTIVSDYAFCGCTNLSTIIAPNALSIGKHAFEGVALTQISNSDFANVGVIGDYAFAGCSSLRNVVFADSLMDIGSHAFYNCSALDNRNNSYRLETANVLRIGESAFEGTAFKRVNIDQGLSALGQSALNISTLETITVNELNTVFSSPENSNLLYNYAKTELILIPAKIGRDNITLEESLQRIWPFAGYHATLGGELTIPVSVDTIGQSALEGTALTKIIFAYNSNPDITITIGPSAFADCDSLTDLVLSYSVAYADVFTGSDNISNIEFVGKPSSAMLNYYNADNYSRMPWYSSNNGISIVFNTDNDQIYNYLLYRPSADSTIVSVSIADGIRTVGQYAFYNCAGLAVLYLPGSVDTLQDYCLDGCVGIKDITFPLSLDMAIDEGNIGIQQLNRLTIIPGITGNYIDYTYSYENAIWSNSTEAYEVTISDGITILGDGMHLKASSLSLTSDLKTIGKEAFIGSTISTIDLKNVTTIGDGAFSDCASLTSLVIPQNISRIGINAFANCTALTTLTGPIDYAYTKAMFDGCELLSRFAFTIGKTGNGADYTTIATTPWKAALSYSTPLNPEISFADSILSIGNRMFDNCYRVVGNDKYGITGNLVLPTKIKSIGECAFRGCASVTGVNLRSCNLLESIGESAFDGCVSIRGALEFGQSVKSLGAYAFANCNSVTSVTLPNSTESISAGSFSNCSGITQLSLPISLNAVGDSSVPAFSGCNSISRVSFTGSAAGFDYSDSPSSNGYYQKTAWYISGATVFVFSDDITSIGANTFRGCTGFTGDLVLPESLTAIGSSAFESTRISKITGTAVLTIGTSAFRNSSVVTVELQMVTVVPDKAFEGCASLAKVTFGNVTAIGDCAFKDSTVKTINNSAVGKSTITSLKSIGINAFASSGVEEVTLGAPAVDLYMGVGVFLDCTSLHTLQIAGNVYTLPADTFRNPSSTFTSVLRSFEANSIQNMLADFSGFESLETVSITGSTVFSTDAGTASFKDCTALHTVSLYSGDSDDLVVLPASMFEGCTELANINLGKVSLENERVFYGCTSLTATEPVNTLSIGSEAFRGCTLLGSVTATKAVTIGQDAFRDTGLSAITSATFPAAVSFGDNAFNGCSNLTSLRIPANLETIGESCFVGTGLTQIEDGIMPKVTAIGAEAFLDVSTLRGTLSLPSVISVNSSVFEGTSLTAITFGAGLVSLQVSALDIDTLTSITVAPGNPAYASFNGVLYNSDYSVLIKVPRLIGNDLALHDDLTTILPEAANGCNLTGTLTVPAGVTSVGESAFAGTGISSLIILTGEPNAFGKDAFANCDSLRTLTLPFTVKYANVFTDTENIEEITFTGSRTSRLGTYYSDMNDVETTKHNYELMPWSSNSCPIEITFADGIEEIDSYMFYHATPDTTVSTLTLPEGMTKIGAYALYNCAGLATITIPNSMQTLDECCLAGCSGITNLTVPVDLDMAIDSVDASKAIGITSLSKITFTYGRYGVGISYTSDIRSSLIWNNCSAPYAVVYADGITSTGNYTYLKASSVTLPASMATIGKYAFPDSTFESVSIPAAVTTVDDYAFSGCAALKNVTLPEGITKVGNGAFKDCVALTTLNAPITLMYTAAMFDGCSELDVFNFSKGSNGVGAQYLPTTVTPWKRITDINTNPIIGFSDDIVSIGKYMFYSCYKQISSSESRGLYGTITLPRNLTSVGDYAFYGDAKVASFTFSRCNVLDTIGAHAFDGCSGITSIALGTSVTGLGANAFANCTSATNLEIPISLDAVGDNDAPAFQGCRITSIRFIGTGAGCAYYEDPQDGPCYTNTPWYISQTTNVDLEAVVSIGDNMFRDCVNISGDLTMPSVRTIGAHAFEGTSVSSVQTSLVNSIGAAAFKDSLVQHVNLPLVTEIPAAAFENCSVLENATFGDVVSVGADAFRNSTVSTINSATLGTISLPFLRAVGDGAFQSSGAVNVTLGTSGVSMNIGSAVLLDCASLKTVAIKGTVDELAADTFRNDLSTFESQMTTFEANETAKLSTDFRGFAKLVTASFTSATEFGTGTFKDCTALKTVGLYSSALSSASTRLLELPGSMFENCVALVNIDMTNLDLVNGMEFYGCKALTAANIPNTEIVPAECFTGCDKLASVTATNAYMIGDSAFRGCGFTELNATAFPDVVFIGRNAFSDCARLATFTSNEGLETISAEAFTGTALASIAGSTAGVNIVGDRAFKDVSTLRGTINLTAAFSVGAQAFDGTSIERVQFGASLASLGDLALRAPQLAAIEFTDDNHNFDLENGILYNEGKTVMIVCPAKNAVSNLTLPATLESILHYAAYGSSLSGILTLPESIKATASIPLAVAEYAFAESRGITGLNLCYTGQNITHETAFQNCTGVQSLRVSNTVKLGNMFAFENSISQYTFFGGQSSGLENYYENNYPYMPWAYAGDSVSVSIVFESGATVDPFMFCFENLSTTITSVDLTPVTSIGTSAFRNCAGLTDLVLSDDVRTLDASALTNCSGLKRITAPISLNLAVNAGGNLGVLALELIHFTPGTKAGYSYTDNYRNTLWYSENQENYNVILDEGIQSIGDNMYLKPLDNVTFPSTLQSIGANAFCGSMMNSVVLNEGLVTLGDNAFGETPIRSLTVPNSLVVSDVNAAPFRNCTQLESATLPITISYAGSMFDGCTSLTSYLFTKGPDGPSSGVGAKYTPSDVSKTPWYIRSQTTKITVEFGPGIVSIGEYMFYGCSGVNGSIDLSGIKTIGQYAFSGCVNITAVEFGNVMDTIGAHAFEKCSELRAITLGTSVRQIGAGTFSNCSSVTSLTIPMSLDTVRDDLDPAFAGCSMIGSVRFIGSGDGFQYSESLGSNNYYRYTPWYVSNSSGKIVITIESGIPSIGKNTFRDCSALDERVELPSSVRSVGEYAFRGCSSIDELVINSVLSSVGKGAFAECRSVRILTLPINLNAVYYADEPIFAEMNALTDIHFTGSAGWVYTGTSGASYYQLTPWYSNSTSLAIDFADSVTSIGAYMFCGCNSLQDPIDLNNVNAIGDNAFQNCTGLKGVTANKVSSAGKNSFENCSELSTVSMSSLRSVAPYMFTNTESLGTVTLSNTCNSIGEHAFENSGVYRINSAGNSVVLTNVSNIGAYAFAGSKVANVIIGSDGNSCTMGDYVFNGCHYLETLQIDSTVNALPYNTFRSAEAMSYAPRLNSIKANRVTNFYANLAEFHDLRLVEIAGTTGFASTVNGTPVAASFKNCDSLAKVVLYNTSASSYRYTLPAEIFRGCTELSNINLTYANLNAQNGYEFYGCTSLPTVEMLYSTAVGDYTFFGCDDLATVSLPKVRTVGQYAFAESGLTRIQTADLGSVTTLASHAFDSCISLGTVDLPLLASVTPTTVVTHDQTGPYTDVFYGCTGLTEVSVNMLKSISTAMFYGCDKLNTVNAESAKTIEVLAFYGCRALQTAEFPQVTVIGNPDADVQYGENGFTGIDNYSVFYNCSMLSSVQTPMLESIGALAFYRCTALVAFNDSTEFVIGNTVTSIGTGAFSGIGATDISLGENATGGIKRISDYVFYDCPQLVNFTSVSLTEVPEHTFNNSDITVKAVNSQLEHITVPAATKFFASLHGITSLLTVDLSSATEFNDAIFYGCTGLTTVTLKNSGTVNLSARMFYNCTSLVTINLERAMLPGNLQTSTSGSVFFGCEKLQTVNMEIATAVSASAFQGCTFLRSVTMPMVTNVGKDAFNGCTALNNVSAPRMTSLEENAFYGCQSLAQLNPNDDGVSGFIRITSIGKNAFYGCGFTKAVLGPMLTTLGPYAFSNNRLLTELVLPNSLTTVSEGAFYNCPLATVYVSSTVRTIAANAFNYSSSSATEATFYFNGPLSGIAFANGAINGSNRVDITVIGSIDSEEVYNLLVRDDQFANLGGSRFEGRNMGTITIESYDDNIIPYISDIRVLYGSKFVLPFYSSGTGYQDYYFASLNGSILAMYASEDDFALGRIARSGDAVPVFALENYGGLDFRAYPDASALEGKSEIELVTNGNGERVRPEFVDVHYGMLYNIPRFESDQTHISSLVLLGPGELEIPIDENTVSIYIGYGFNEISMQSADTTVTVYFFRDGVRYDATVLLRSPFVYPDDLKNDKGEPYLEFPDPGYEFIGWYSAENGGYKADSTTTFKNGQSWYARFTPLPYLVKVMDSSGTYASVNVLGPYVLYNTAGDLYYTDLEHTEQTLLIRSIDVEGYTITTYMDSGYKAIREGEDTGSLTGDRSVVINKTVKYYSIKLEFLYNGEKVADSETFTINNWISPENTYSNASPTIDNVPFTVFQQGLVVPTPLSDKYTMSQLIVNDRPVVYTDNQYVVDNSYLNLATDVKMSFVLVSGQFSIDFNIGDDAGSVINNGLVYSQHDIITIIADTGFQKVGYNFLGFTIPGHVGLLTPMSQVELTEEMINKSKYCVVTAEGVWSELEYSVKFDLNGYTGQDAPAPLTGIQIGMTITLPSSASIYRVGQQITGWHFILGETKIGTQSHATNFVLEKIMLEEFADSNRTLTLQCEWSAKSYTVQVDPDSGTKQFLDIKNVKYGDTISLWDIGTYSKSFMMFGGWSVGPDGTKYPSAATARIDDEIANYGDTHDGVITFYFVWISNEYRIQYDLGEGGVSGNPPIDNNVYIVDVTDLALAGSDGFQKRGYSFAGWKYSPTSTTIYVSTGKFDSRLATSADSNGVVTLYAVWDQKEYKIAYNLKGGIAGPFAPVSVMYGEDVKISSPTQAGYDFLGWRASTASTSSGVLDPGASFESSSGFVPWDGSKTVKRSGYDYNVFRDLCATDGGTVVFEAVWDNATYSVSYDKKGGTGTIINEITQIKVGDVITLPTFSDASKTGYTFGGWSIDGTNPLQPGTLFSTDMVEGGVNTVVFVAVWDANPYTVKYRYTADQTYATMDANYTVAFRVPTYDRSGYTFGGWSINGADSNAMWSNDGVSWYKIGTSTVKGTYFKNLTSALNGTVTIDAIWSPISYRLVYNANGGTGQVPVDSELYIIGNKVTLKDYHVLDGTNGSKVVIGWSLDSKGSTTTITEFTEGLASRADVTNTVILYAAWIEGMCNVSIDLTGITVSEVPAGWVQSTPGVYTTSVEYGASMKDVMSAWDRVTLTKDGYSFSGWNYGSGTVSGNIEVNPTFDAVDMNIMYIFAGVIGAAVVGVVVLTRFRF